MKITQSGGSGASSRSETPTGKAASVPAKKDDEDERQDQKVERFEEDYESSEDTSATGGTVEDDGWNVVPMKAKSRSTGRLRHHGGLC